MAKSERSILSWPIVKFVDRFFAAEVRRRVDLATRALDDSRDRAFSRKAEGDRDRYAYNREELLQQCLDAWRDNPLARRIVELTSDYVVGGGIGVEAEDQAAHDFLDEWWNHRLNHMPVRCFEWCDELTRSGEIFPVISTDASGMSYVRAIPALDVQEIVSAQNDIEQELSYKQRPAIAGDEPIIWQAYDQQADAPDESGAFAPAMLHYAINRPVGAQRGESDLAPLLKWLTRYSAWLEDRVRLNRFRQVFLYWVHRAFGNEAERLRRQADLNANPPNPGSILVTDEEEKWEVLQPRLDSFEAKEDGAALKKMIASGAGIPLHFLAEPESSTRTTAEASGGPTFRHYGRRQEFFIYLIADIARIALRRRSFVDRRVDADTVLKVKGTDISVRDNAMLAEAASKVVTAFNTLRDRGLITEEELLRVSYRFAGEIVDVPAILAAAKSELCTRSPQSKIPRFTTGRSEGGGDPAHSAGQAPPSAPPQRAFSGEQLSCSRFPSPCPLPAEVQGRTALTELVTPSPLSPLPRTGAGKLESGELGWLRQPNSPAESPVRTCQHRETSEPPPRLGGDTSARWPLDNQGREDVAGGGEKHALKVSAPESAGEQEGDQGSGVSHVPDTQSAIGGKENGTA